MCFLFSNLQRFHTPDSLEQKDTTPSDLPVFWKHKDVHFDPKWLPGTIAGHIYTYIDSAMNAEFYAILGRTLIFVNRF